ncbi:MAG: HAD family hydrolase [Pseudoruegeria sp.]
MYENLTTVGLDADDTLWQNEQFFRMTQARFAELLRDHVDPVGLQDRLLAAERRNLGHYGYGIKGFVLSMIETALDVTEDKVPASVVRELITAGQDMLQHPIHLLPGIQEAVEWLACRYRLVLITKGDLLDQERKLAQSGLGDHFAGVEIVSDKTPQNYTEIFERHGGSVVTSLMVGNSLRSDILPALQAGAYGVYVPHDLTWSLEHAEEPTTHPRYRRCDSLGQFVTTLARFY